MISVQCGKGHLAVLRGSCAGVWNNKPRASPWLLLAESKGHGGDGKLPCGMGLLKGEQPSLALCDATPVSQEVPGLLADELTPFSGSHCTPKAF